MQRSYFTDIEHFYFVVVLISTNIFGALIFMKIKGIHLFFIIVMRKFVLITEMLYIFSIISKMIYIYIICIFYISHKN